ncbi:MAG: hypothetical protein GXX10_08515 [Clostridiaceae bacterium]|jgi:hypothetical protein|nr:hypothetical protein [Clostridiaceae bacterium]
MVNLEQMSREELIEVIKIKDELLKELREELEAYRQLVSELQAKLGIVDYPYSGNGD